MKGFSKDAFREIVKESRSPKNSVTKASFESVAFDSVTGNQGAILGRVYNESNNVKRFSHVEHQLQKEIRPYFDKQNINSVSIGDHPDFIYLAGTESVENHHVCSLFLDIKNSTALSFRYDLQDVVWIKNSILRAASEIVRSMDGNVHRFMGDALLAFFGDKSNSSENSIINAINCCSVLESYMVNTFIPVLVEEGFDARDLGFRIGLDYGKDEEVLWASYGFSEVFEVTATSFYVDVASKLQSMARKNTTMLGANIIAAIDFPSEFTSKKKIMKDGEYVDVDTLNRTYIDKEGKSLKYKIRELKVSSYRDLLPLDHGVRASLPGSSLVFNESITFKCYLVASDGVKTEYKSVSSALSKSQNLNFQLTIMKSLYVGSTSFPLTAFFEKRNYGVEAQLREDAGIFEKGSEQVTLSKQAVSNSFFFPGKTIDVPETTLYRGLHTMQVIVKDALNEVIFKNIIGVYVE